MGRTECVDADLIQRLLRKVSRGKAAEVDELLEELSPVLELVRGTDELLFKADVGDPNLIRVGVECTVRLEAHAYAAGVVMTALGTHDVTTMAQDERRKLLAPAVALWTWAVGRDLRNPLKRRDGIERVLDDILQGAGNDLPDELLDSLGESQVTLGKGWFGIALAFILLHELAHLKYRHTYCEGFVSIQQENDADRFAAEWLMEAASEEGHAARLNTQYGISVSLLWLTIFNVFMGEKETTTHPQGYDRLFQVLDHVIDRHDDDERDLVWDFVSRMLSSHMWAAGFNFDEDDAKHMQGDPRDKVNHLINRIVDQDRK